MTPVRPTATPSTRGMRKSAMRTTLAVCITLAAVCGSGYQSSVTGTPGSLAAAAAARTAGSTGIATGWVGRELLALPTPTNQNFLVPGQPLELDDSPGGSAPGPRDSAQSKSADDVVQVTSVLTDDPARPGPGTLMSPLNALSPSSAFGERVNPITGEPGEFHSGLDFGASCGTPVRAADAGTVRAVGWHPWGGGNRVEIDHGNGLITTYNHLEGISVKTGDTVAVSQIVATVGTTGSSTGCHLHFETIRDGSQVDPKGWILTPLTLSALVRTPDMTSYAPGGAGSGDSVPWVIAMPYEASHEGEPLAAGDTGTVIMAGPVLPVPATDSAVPRTFPKRPASAAGQPSPKAPATPKHPVSSNPAPTLDGTDPGKADPGKDSTPAPSPSPSPPGTASGNDPAPPPSVVPAPSPTPEPNPSAEPTPEPTPSLDPVPDPPPSPGPTPDPSPDPSPNPIPEPTPEPDPGCDVGPDPVTDPEAAVGLGSDKETGLEPVKSHIPSPLPIRIPDPVLNRKHSADDSNPESGIDSGDGVQPEGEASGDPGLECDGGGDPDPDDEAADESADETEDTGVVSQDAVTLDPAKP